MNLSRKELKKYIYDNHIVKNGLYNFRKMLNKEAKKTIEENINQYTTKCSSDRIMERVYWIVNDLNNYPKRCKRCQCDITIFGEWKKPYNNTYCSHQCSSDCVIRAKSVAKTNLKRYGAENSFGSKIIRKKAKQTMIDRYGVDHNMKSPEMREKAKQTMIERYGVDHALQSPEIMEKLKKTTFDRYGVENVFEDAEIKNKIKATNMERYGVFHPAQSSKIKEKMQATSMVKYGVKYPLLSPMVQDKKKKSNLEKYGVENPLSLPEIQAKKKATNIERYGVDNVFKSDIIKDQLKSLNLKKYGVEYAFQSDEFKQYVKELNLEKYGVEYASQSQYIKNKSKKMHQENFYSDINNRNGNIVSPLFLGNEYKNASILHPYKWKCNKCNNEFNDHLANGRIPVCRKCHPLTESTGEREVKEFLKSLNINILENDRKIIKPKELDIVIPEKKIAIEYNGLYWHSDIHKLDNNYHKNKFEQANKQGYRLITIFEDEWINKRDICEARLKHILGISDNICYARQTTIKEITNKEHKDFLNKHHIQGFVGAKIKLGAYYKDELVALMTFGKKRRALGNKIQTPNTYELLRFCTNGNIPGIGSKLFKHFTRNYNPTEIISYCDLRWGTGAVYEKLGFKLSHITGPNYWYSENGITRQHRFQFRKQALTEMDSYSSNKTEFQIMDEEGYYRIYDCGNKVFKRLL